MSRKESLQRAFANANVRGFSPLPKSSLICCIISQQSSCFHQTEKGHHRSGIPYSLEVIKANQFGCAGKPWLTRYFLTRSNEASETASQ